MSRYEESPPESLADIAGILTRDGVLPPRANTRHRKKGWVDTTVRGMLRNEAYIGWWTYKKKQWKKVPGTNNRRYRRRPEADALRSFYEERRIVDEETWAAVQARLQLLRRGLGTTAGTATGVRNRYALSGLLRCGHCGTPMVITGGSSSSYYVCGAAKKRQTCPNRKSLREDTARARIFDALERRFTSPEAIGFLRQAIVDELKRLSSSANTELREHQERLVRTEERLAKLVDFIAAGNMSPTVASTINDLEAQAGNERAAIDSLKRRVSQPTVLPSPEAILAGGLRLRQTLDGDPVGAREHLRHLFGASGIVMTPQDDGSYLAQGKYFPLLALADPGLNKAQRPGGGPPGRGTSVSCAGTLSDEYTRLIEPVAVVLHLPPPVNRRRRPDLWKRRGAA